MESESLMSPALAGRFFTSSAIWETCNMKVRELAGLDQDVHDNICYGAWLIADFCPVTLVQSSTPVTVV